VLNLRLDDPDRAVGFGDHFRGAGGDVPANFQNWQFLAYQDAVLVRGTVPALVIGSWLLATAAVVGVAGLVAGRAAQQTRRIGLLKAVGATPGLVAVVLLVEHLLLAAVAAALGLLVGSLAAPALADPSAGLLGGAVPPSAGAIVGVAALAVVVPLCAALGPAVRAATTSTVRALADGPREAQRRAPLTALSAHLPTPLLLGVRLIVRRPRRAVLVAVSTATVSVMASAMVVLDHQTLRGYDFGDTVLANLHDAQTTRVMYGVSVALGLLAVVNTVVLTWSIGLEARHSLAIARTLGATPGQITAGLTVAQVLPALPGAVVGCPLGVLLFLLFSAPGVTVPSAGSLLAALLAILLGTAACAAVPAWAHTRRPATHVLSAETA
jgi:putative ABC transport system permease protein